MAKKYIWQYPAWPNLQWDEQALAPLITQCRKKQHFLLGAVSVLGFDLRLQAQGIILVQLSVNHPMLLTATR